MHLAPEDPTRAAPSSGCFLTAGVLFLCAAKVSEPAEKLCSESVQPYLGSVLEELMEPISSGFQEGRQLSESLMDQVCQDVLLQDDNEQLKKVRLGNSDSFPSL